MGDINARSDRADITSTLQFFSSELKFNSMTVLDENSLKCSQSDIGLGVSQTFAPSDKADIK